MARLYQTASTVHVKNDSGKPDFVPDENAIYEKVDDMNNVIVQYRKKFNNKTRSYDDVAFRAVDPSTIRAEDNPKNRPVEDRMAEAMEKAGITKKQEESSVPVPSKMPPQFACDVEGCEYKSKSKAGVSAHKRHKHSAPKVEATT